MISRFESSNGEIVQSKLKHVSKYDLQNSLIFREFCESLVRLFDWLRVKAHLLHDFQR